MRFLASAACAAAILFAPMAAEARGWSIFDLGLVDSEAKCTELGKILFERYGAEHVSVAGRHVVAYGIGGLDLDGTVTCGRTDSLQHVAMLTLHTWSDDPALDDRRYEIGLELDRLWAKGPGWF